MPRPAARAPEQQIEPRPDPVPVGPPHRPLAVFPPQGAPGTVTIRLGLVFPVLWLAAAVIVALSLAQDLLISLAPETGFEERIYRFDLDTEASLPTWFSACLLLAAALSLLFIAVQVNRQQRRKAIPWFLLSVIFLVLSLDEVAMLHEWLSAYLSARMDNSGVFYFAWTLPALVVCVAGLICFVPFILSFKGLDRVILIASAVVFLSGAIGMEMLGGAEAQAAGIDTLHYRLFVTVEEGLEYAGVLLFLWFILRRARAEHGETTIRFA